MKVSKSSLRRTLIAIAATGGLAAWSVPGLTESTPMPPTGVGPGMMGGYATQGAEGPGAQGGYAPGYGYGMGPGMMYGYGGGYGPGMMGGYGGGYGPGMMGGYGMGPGMMYGYGPGMMGGYGMGPGMMGGYGMGPGTTYGYGPGMMGGYGMGPGMMYGYGPGMTYGYGPAYGALDLSDEQSAKVEKIYSEARQKQWDLATKSITATAKLGELLAAEKPDQKAVASAYRALADLRLKRLELSLDIRTKVEAVLTKEQREQLQNWRAGWMGPWR